MKITCSGCLNTFNLEGPPGKEFRCRCGNKLVIPQKEVKDQFGVVYCSGCWTRYAVAGRKSGAKFKCKRCESMVTIRNTGNTSPEPAVAKASSAQPASAGDAPKESDFDNAQTQIIDSKSLTEVKKAAEVAHAAKEPVKTPVNRPGARPGSGVTRPHSRPPSRTGPAVRNGPSGVVEASGAQGAASPDPELKRRITSLERELAELRPKTADLEKERNSLQRSVKEKDALVSAKDAELSAATSRLNEAQGLVKNGAETITSLQSALSTANHEIDEMKGSIAARDKDIAGLKAKITGLEQEIQKLNEEMKSRVTREETERFHTEKKAMDERISAIALELAATREAFSLVLGRADALTAEIRGLQDKTGKFDSLPDISKELDIARKGRDAAGKERDSAVKERDVLKNRINDLESVVGEMQRSIETREEPPQSVWQRGAAKLFGLFSRSSETQAARTGAPPTIRNRAPVSASDDVVMPNQVEELGDDIPPEPIPVDDDELLANPPVSTDEDTVVGKADAQPVGTKKVPDEGVEIGNMKTNVLPTVGKPQGPPPPKMADRNAAAAALARKRRRNLAR
jgi:predicted  nucleic acid-binding Zn-ribbon protein